MIKKLEAQAENQENYDQTLEDTTLDTVSSEVIRPRRET